MRTGIIAGIILLVVVFSVLYVFFGKNWLVEQQYIQKEKNSAYLKNELMNRFLEIHDQSQELLNQILQDSYEIELFPNKNVYLDSAVLHEAESIITLNPIFDFKYIYLVSGNELSVYDKTCSELKWDMQFGSELKSLQLLDANRLMAFTESGNMHCFNRETGQMMWEKTGYRSDMSGSENSRIKQISLNRYHQLDSSVLLISEENKLTLLNNINGNEITTFAVTDRLDFISDFDLIEKCVYTVVKNKLSKLEFKVKY